MFVDCAQAKDLVDNNTVVVVVDTKQTKLYRVSGSSLSDQDDRGAGSSQKRQ